MVLGRISTNHHDEIGDNDVVMEEVMMDEKVSSSVGQLDEGHINGDSRDDADGRMEHLHTKALLAKSSTAPAAISDIVSVSNTAKQPNVSHDA